MATKSLYTSRYEGVEIGYKQTGVLFRYGTGLVDGYITSLNDTTNTVVTVTLNNNSDEVLVTLLDTTYSFSANTPVTLSAIAEDSLLITEDYTQTIGDYYVKLTVASEVLTDRYSIYENSVDLSNATISDSTIAQDSSVIISATIDVDAVYAFVSFVDESGDVVYSQAMDISGTTASCTTMPGKIPVDTYSAGQIIIFALLDSSPDVYASLATLELTVTANTGMKSGALRWLAETVYIKYNSGLDDNGYTTYGDWTAVSARIERTTQKVMDANGVMVTSTAQIYVSGDNAVGILDRVKLSNDFSTTAEARIIRVNTLSDASGSDEVKVVYT